MKIGIPTEEKNLEGAVSISFGRASFFAIYDTESKNATFLDNGAVLKQGGAGILAAQQLVDEGIDVLLTPRCGGNAQDVLRGASIEIYKTKPMNLLENVSAHGKGELQVLTEVQQGHMFGQGK